MSTFPTNAGRKTYSFTSAELRNYLPPEEKHLSSDQMETRFTNYVSEISKGQGGEEVVTFTFTPSQLRKELKLNAYQPIPQASQAAKEGRSTLESSHQTAPQAGPSWREATEITVSSGDQTTIRATPSISKTSPKERD